MFGSCFCHDRFGAIGFYDDLLKVTKQTTKFSGSGGSPRKTIAASPARDDETRPPHTTALACGDQCFVIDLGIFFLPSEHS